MTTSERTNTPTNDTLPSGRALTNEELCRLQGQKEHPLYCSFCGKSQNEVSCVIAGPSVFICDECVGLCSDIIAQSKAKTAPQETLFDAIAHGDEKHRAWLKQAIEDHFAGRPVEKP